MKSLLKIALLQALSVASFFNRKSRFTVLMYHSLSNDGDFFSVSPEAFEKQIQRLARVADIVPLASVTAYLGGAPLQRDAVVITFDDGYEDFVYAALPILRKYNAPATLFVSGGLVDPAALGNEKPLVDARHGQALKDPLVALGSHAISHAKLTRLSPAEALHEIVGSKKGVQEIFGSDPQFFAYPKGSYSAQLEEMVRDAGYRGACTAVNRSVKRDDRTMAIPRIQVDGTTSLPLFVLLLGPAADWYYALWKVFSRYV